MPYLLAVLPEELPLGLLRLRGVSESGAGSGAVLGVGVRFPDPTDAGLGPPGPNRTVGVSGLPDSGSSGPAPETHGWSGDMAACGTPEKRTFGYEMGLLGQQSLSHVQNVCGRLKIYFTKVV